MNYPQAEEFLFNQLANYHQSGGDAYKPGLERIDRFLDSIGNPHHSLNVIHVAGTNGKGSVTHMLSSVFQEAGHQVGLFTSPHLIDFRERFKLNGKMISKEKILDFVLKHKDQDYCQGISFFEWCTALALDFFNESKVDLAIIETGLGGRLDATNIVNAQICAITNISMDHQSFLGNDLESIAKEKAGIIKAQSKVFLGDIDDKLKHVFEEKCHQEDAILMENSSHHDLKTDLKGDFQNKNLNLLHAITTTWIEENRAPNISWDQVNQGLMKVLKNTGLKGRWQTIQSLPNVVCDTGHNLAAFKMIIHELKNSGNNNIHMILGLAKDKDHEAIFSLLPKNWNYYFPQFKSTRLTSPYELVKKAEIHRLKTCIWKGLDLNYNTLINNVPEDHTVFIGGSNFVVAEFLEKE